MPKIFVIPGSGSGEDVFNWNIEANVGPNSPNRRIDVELVQFGYFTAQFNTTFNPDQRRIFAAVVPGATYTGTAADPLTLAIITHQKDRGGTQDGHVSVIHGRTGVYDGKHAFMLIALNNNMRLLMKADYPRIDKHDKCSTELRKSVLKSLGLDK